MSRFKAAMAVLFIFLAGAVCGGLASVRVAPLWRLMHMPSRAEVFERVQQHLAWQLSLSASQKQAVAAILADSQKQLAEIRQDVDPRVRAVIAGAHDRIRSQLTEEQKVRFDRLAREGWAHVESLLNH